jgi:hypothetical protein
MKKTRPWMHKLPAWVERNPRVVNARERWERGELSSEGLYRIRHLAAGLCGRCSRPFFARGVCEYHYDKVRERDIKRSAKARNAARIDKNTRAGVSPDAHSVKSCPKCGTLRKMSSTCNNGVHR